MQTEQALDRLKVFQMALPQLVYLRKAGLDVAVALYHC